VRHKNQVDQNRILERCLAAFVQAGTLDLSLDRLARAVGTSKRMLIHYFGGREAIEERAMTLLESRLRAQFAPDTFPPRVTARIVVTTLWDRATAPESKRVLLLVMDLSRRAWNGSERAKAFYEEQQRLWVELLMKFTPNAGTVEAVLQLFQGAVLAYLVTGNKTSGRRVLQQMVTMASRPSGNARGKTA
jgi:AcrR family transcriptional regulator